MSSLITEAQLNFKLGNKIGGGGEGDVFIAHDLQLDALLAVKKIPHSKFTDESQFFEESKKLYLTKHHNIVEVNYGCKDEDFVYLAMPYYSNGSLKSLTDKRFLTAHEVIRYALQFLSGLNHIHTKRLLHFDVKLGNILLSKSNKALLSDFGLAQYTGNYGFSHVFGTTEVFAPPEFFKQAKHNLKFDIYQAGITLYRMCVGDVIFRSQIEDAFTKWNKKDRKYFIEAVLNGNFPNRSYHFPHIPISMRSVISKALEPNPDNRYDSVLDMMNDLANIRNANGWYFQTDYSTNEKWEQKGYVVTAQENNGDWEVIAKKNGRRKTKFCGNGLTTADKNNLLYGCLTKEW